MICKGGRVGVSVSPSQVTSLNKHPPFCWLKSQRWLAGSERGASRTRRKLDTTHGYDISLEYYSVLNMPLAATNEKKDTLPRLPVLSYVCQHDFGVSGLVA